MYFHHYSAAATQSQSPFCVDYLVNRLGFTRKKALSADKKKEKYKFTENDPDSVINFFENLGLSKSQIKSIVSANPRLLSFHVDKILRPKVHALNEIGLSGKDLVKILIKDKFFFNRSLDKQIKPSIEYLRNALGMDKNVAEVLRKYHAFFRFYKPKTVAKKIEFLEKIGFPTDYVPKFLIRNPRCFISRNEWLEKIFHRVETEFGISPRSKMFYHTFLAVAGLMNSMDTRFELFRGFGFSNASVYEMVRRSPSVLCVSEKKIKETWSYWVDELGYQPCYLVNHPIVFSFSLDKRVKPRNEVLNILNEKKLMKRSISLYTILCRTESRFISTYLLPHKDVIADAYGSYLKAVGWKEKDVKLLV